MSPTAPPTVWPMRRTNACSSQMTTAGDISGTLNAQIFPNGVGADEIFKTFTYDGTGTFNADGESPVRQRMGYRSRSVELR